MRDARINFIKVKDIQKPTYYVVALDGEFASHAYNEERAEKIKGRWRQEWLKRDIVEEKNIALDALPAEKYLDLEIGTGNGFFFAHQAMRAPDRLLLGIEIKFKPLIQAIRRTLKNNSQNARIVRYDAHFLENLFQNGELNNVYVHHPDPWTKRRRYKHRLLNQEFLNKLYELQKPNSFLEFKTDSEDYFFWAVKEFEKSKYKIFRYSEDLHKSDWKDENFITHFEQIYASKGQPIYYLRAAR
jgi:tRNA (guanine-N7-)-methyltransferase